MRYPMWRRSFRDEQGPPRRIWSKAIAAIALVGSFGMFVDQAPASAAVLPILPPSTQFDITGFLQAATLDQACLTSAAANLDSNGFPQAAHCGGTMTLNGHTIVVPAETIAILPASALTWEELFAQAPAPYGIPGNPGVTTSVPTTGMAMADIPKPLTTYEVQAVGNRVIVGGQDRYI